VLQTIGPARFVFGTGQPLRLPETAIAKLDLLDIDPDHRAAIESTNARAAGNGGTP
jgi:predicted TIM-barrel fold metal-dependent hydrolase